MIKKIRLITVMLTVFLLSLNSLADHATTAPEENINKHNNGDELQKIINDFDSYIAGVSLNVREEVKEYRIKIASINKEKRELYKRLTQEAQSYLSEEQKYKKRILALKKESSNNQENFNSNENNEIAK